MREFLQKFFLIGILVPFLGVCTLWAQGPNCINSDPFCTGTTYTFPNSTNVPNLGAINCLGSSPNPAWYYMEVDVAGNMAIQINQTNGSGSGIDVDFVLFGPYPSLAAACATIPGGPVEDCSYSTASVETADITGGIVGEVYVLLLTNFSNQPGTITFSQTGGSGSADCSLLCGITGFTANPSACTPATNTYGVTGTLSISNPPASGTLTISNSCGGSQVFNAPFATNINYSFPGLTANGAGCTVTATWSADPNCNTSTTYTAPAACNVTPCLMTNFNVNIGACVAATGNYQVTGTLQFNNPPPAGQLIIQTCGGNQTVINPPFASPVNFSINNIPADGTTNCNVTAFFTSDPACTISVGPYNEPTCPCNMDFLSVTINPCDPATNDFYIDAYLEFTSPPAGGQLIIQNCSGDQVVINPPFVSPINTQILGINSDGTPNCSVTAFFTASPACTITSPTYTEPVACGCPADAGNVNVVLTGSGINNYVLCQNDQIDITSSGFTFPNDVGVIGGNPYQPGIGYLIYSCPPTPGLDPTVDPCFEGAINPATSSFMDINDAISWFAAFPPGTFANNTVYYVPFTFYTAPNLVFNVACWDLGPATAITYLPPIVSNGVQNCAAGTVTVTVSGGYPALFGGNFTASNLLPATASFNNTTATNGGTITISGLTGGQNYSFTITDANGCPHNFTGGPFIGPNVPVVNNAGPFCIGDPAVNLTVVTFPGGTWAGNGITNAAAGTFNPGVAGLGSHQIIYTAPGCGSTDTITIIVNDAFDATINPAGPFCQSNPNTFLVAADPGGTWSGTGIVNAATGEFSPSIAGPGIHVITYTIAGGCGDIQNTNIQVIADANAAINPAGPFCSSDPAVNLTALQPGGTWSGTGITNAALGTFNPATAGVGTHVITYTISGVCGDAQNINITVNGLANSTITPAGPFCVNAPSGNLSAAQGGGTWSGNGITNAATGAFNPSIAGPGTHTITYTIGGACGTSSTTDIVVNALPVVSFIVDNASGCSPVNATITNTSVPIGNACNWTINGMSVSSNCASYSATFTSPGCYDVGLTTTDGNGCTNNAVVNSMICVSPNPIADFTFNPNNATVLDPTVHFTNTSVNGATYIWDFSGLGTSTAVNPTFVFPDVSGGSYLVCLDVTSANGCVDTVCKIIQIYDEFLIYVPNAFTPDNDGKNDFFLPIVSGHDPDSYEFLIFDRWGELIFESYVAGQAWDGFHNGRLAKQDVYVWKLKAKKASSGEKKVYYGHVSLLK